MGGLFFLLFAYSPIIVKMLSAPAAVSRNASVPMVNNTCFTVCPPFLVVVVVVLVGLLNGRALQLVSLRLDILEPVP